MYLFGKKNYTMNLIILSDKRPEAFKRIGLLRFIVRYITLWLDKVNNLKLIKRWLFCSIKCKINTVTYLAKIVL
jgi:hypothetical protein